jgi:hypothetical protein
MRYIRPVRVRGRIRINGAVLRNVSRALPPDAATAQSIPSTRAASARARTCPYCCWFLTRTDFSRENPPFGVEQLKCLLDERSSASHSFDRRPPARTRVTATGTPCNTRNRSIICGRGKEGEKKSSN